MEDTKKIISGLKQLSQFGLDINFNKSQILGGVPCLTGETEIDGIKIFKKVKYLGYTYSRTRTQLYTDTRNNMKKHIGHVLGKLN